MKSQFIKVDKDLLASDLGGGAVLVLALIESLDPGDGCFASNAYLAKCRGISESAMSDTIGKLKKGGHIQIAKSHFQGASKRVMRSTKKYRNPEIPFAENRIGSTQSPEAGLPDSENGVAKNCPYNRRVMRLEDKISEYTNNPELQEALLEFMEVRKKLKAQNSKRGLNRLLADLDALASDEHLKIQIVDQSISNGWKGVFPLKKGGDVRASYRKNADGTYEDHQGFPMY